MDNTPIIMINPIWILREGWCVHWPHWPYMYSFIQASTTVPALTSLRSPDMAVTRAPSTQSCLQLSAQPPLMGGMTASSSPAWSLSSWLSRSRYSSLRERTTFSAITLSLRRKQVITSLLHLPSMSYKSVWKDMYLKQWNWKFCNQALTWVKRVGLVPAV